MTKSKVKIRTPYDGQRVGKAKSFSLPSLTKQSFKDDCDINKIVDRFARTGVIDHIAKRQPQYVDCTSVTTYLDAMQAVKDADAQFAALPARVRRFFDNDPAQFLAAFDDPDMREDLLDLGLIEAPEVVDPPADPPPSEPTRAEGDSKDS